MPPLLSIVVPTRNRARYAIHTIESLLAIPSPSIEIVVQDSSDTDDLGATFGKQPRDPRLVYHYSPPPLNMVENFDLGVRHASGEYICAIGDDDGVNPEIVAATEWALANDYDALAPRSDIASYYWPDFRSWHSGDREAGALLIRQFTGQYSLSDPASAMAGCAHQAGQLRSTAHLPKVYLGIVRKRCLDRVRDATGAYFGGVSPDVYGALAVANFARNVCELDYPLIMPGASGGSNSGLSATRRHVGKIEEAEHLKDFRNLQWPECVPPFFSVQTVWAQSAYAALYELGRTDLIAEFNFPLLYALCLTSHPDYLTYTITSLWRTFRKTGRSRLGQCLACAASLIGVNWRRTRFVASRMVRRRSAPAGIWIRSLPHTGDAIRALQHYLSESGRSFAQAVASQKSLVAR